MRQAESHRGLLKNKTKQNKTQILVPLGIKRTSLVVQTVKHLSRMQETGFEPWVGKIPLEKEMAIHSSTIAWKIPWTEGPGRLQSMGSQRVGHD